MLKALETHPPFSQRLKIAGAIVKCPARLYDLRIKDSDSAEVKAPNVEAWRGQIDPAAGLRLAAQDHLP